MRSWVGAEILTGMECWTDELGVWDIGCNKVVGWVEGSAGIAERRVMDIRMTDGDSMVRDGVESSTMGKDGENTGQRWNLLGKGLLAGGGMGTLARCRRMEGWWNSGGVKGKKDVGWDDGVTAAGMGWREVVREDVVMVAGRVERLCMVAVERKKDEDAGCNDSCRGRKGEAGRVDQYKPRGRPGGVRDGSVMRVGSRWGVCKVQMDDPWVRWAVTSENGVSDREEDEEEEWRWRTWWMRRIVVWIRWRWGTLLPDARNRCSGSTGVGSRLGMSGQHRRRWSGWGCLQ